MLRRWIDGTLRLASAVLALWSCTALGGAVSDHLDVLTHFAPLVLAASVAVSTLAALLARKKRAPLIAAAAAAVWSSVLIAPEMIGAATQERDAKGSRLKVVTFNLWGRNLDAEATADFILRADADVILLQEVFGRAAGIPRRLRAEYPHGVVCAEQRCSLAILSRHPIERSGMQRQRWPAEPLSVVWAEIDAPGGGFTALTTHYTWPTFVHHQERQRAALAGLTRSFPKNDLIVAADFNLTPWSRALREQDARLGLRRRTRALFSWPVVASRHLVPSPVPLLPIDHVYAGAGWRTVSAERGPRLGSDHYPVVVTLARAQPPSSVPRAHSGRAALRRRP